MVLNKVPGYMLGEASWWAMEELSFPVQDYPGKKRVNMTTE